MPEWPSPDPSLRARRPAGEYAQASRHIRILENDKFSAYARETRQTCLGLGRLVNAEAADNN
jgi:hypothetical protein